MRDPLPIIASLLLLGCSAPPPDRVSLTLAPDLVSSTSATLNARAVVAHLDEVLSGWNVKLSVEYKDRNDAPHAIAEVSALSDATGLVEGALTGLGWEGSGTVTAAVVDDQGMPALDEDKAPVTARATFAVLDETAPKLTITAPSAGQHLPRGRYTVTVNATDEIGVSQVYIQAVNMGGGMGGGGGGGGGNADRTRSTILASGTTAGVVTLEFSSEGANVGDTIALYSMAADMSGNLAVASSISIVVDPAN